MNPSPYEILTEMKVRIPQEYCVDKFSSNQYKENYFYCRFSSNSGQSSGLYKGEEITNDIDRFRQMQQNKELLKIEEVINCVCGCVIYINNGYIYGEFVDGHIMSLLRKGVCSIRFLIDSNNRVYLIKQFQHWIVNLINDKYIFGPNNHFNEVQLRLIQDLIIYLHEINLTKNNSLYEILVSKDDFVFCDAKVFSKDDFFIDAKQLFISDDNNIVIKYPIKKIDSDSLNQIDCLDVDYKTMIDNNTNNNITVYNDALLSHYMTRNFKYFNSVYFLRRDNKLRYSKIDFSLPTVNWLKI
jgi:hypothetical protein